MKIHEDQSTVIEASVLDTLKVLLGGMTAAFTAFTKWGIQLGKAQEQKGVFKEPLKLKDGSIFNVYYKYSDDTESVVKVKVEDDEGNEIKRTNIKLGDPITEGMDKKAQDKLKRSHSTKLHNVILEMLNEGWNLTVEDLKDGQGYKSKRKSSKKKTEQQNESNSNNDNTANETTEGPQQDASSSRTLRATLKKVCSAEGENIHLIRICGSYATDAMMNDLNTVLDNPDILSTLGEEPTTIKIVDEGQEFDIQPCELSEEECIRESLLVLIRCAYTRLHNIQAIHWNAKGDKFQEIHSRSDGFIWSLRSKIDQLAELCVQLTGDVPHPSMLMSLDSSLNTQSGFEGVEGLQMLKDEMLDFKECLEFYVCNFSADVQQMIQMWIRDISHECEYLLGRSIDSNSNTTTPIPSI